MISVLRNNASLGNPMPDTIEKAYKIASTWTNPKTSSSATSHSAVFMLADELVLTVVTDPPGGRGGRGRGGRDARGGGRGDNRGGSSRGRGDGRGSGRPTATTGSSEEYVERRTCRGCFKKGHLFKDCPDQAPTNTTPTVLPPPTAATFYAAAVGEHDPFDIRSMFMMTDTMAMVLHTNFNTDEVLLDNCSGALLFRDDRLLHDVQPMDRPQTIGGVNSTDAPMTVTHAGRLSDFSKLGRRVGVSRTSAANIMSEAILRDAGYNIERFQNPDEYRVHGDTKTYVFRRRLFSGVKSSHYSCNMSNDVVPKLITDPVHAYVTTVEENKQAFTKREVKGAAAGRELMRRMAHSSKDSTIEFVEQGVKGLEVTTHDVQRGAAIWGDVSYASFKGKTKKQKTPASTIVVAPRVTQQQQILSVDVFFVYSMAFLLGILSPLGLVICVPLANRETEEIAAGLHTMIAVGKKRDFDIQFIASDGEGAVGKIKAELESVHKLTVDITGAGGHVKVIERMIQTVKSRVRCHVHDLPFTMSKLLVTMCVLFCVSRINMIPNSTSVSRISPIVQYSGHQIDARRQLRCAFGDYVQATEPETTSNVKDARTYGCITLLPMGNDVGSVKMLRLSTNKLVNRTHFTILPMPDSVIQHLNKLAEDDGITRLDDIAVDIPDPDSDDDGNALLEPAPSLPTTMPVEGRKDVPLPPSDADDSSEAGVFEHIRFEKVIENVEPRRSTRETRKPDRYGFILDTDVAVARFYAGRKYENTSSWEYNDFVFKMSAKLALREREHEAVSVIKGELQQIVDKRVWHGVHWRNLTVDEKKRVIRSSMFLKDKYHAASGEFDKFKARLVGGGDQQDKSLYDNLSAPTAATTSVLIAAAISASEGRIVEVVDIGGAFLNADMDKSGVLVHMRLDKLMSAFLVQIDHSYEAFLETDGTMLVELDKALYGCVEAARLWYLDLKEKLIGYGFEINAHDPCVFNMIGAEGKQITITLHVDDLMISCCTQHDVDGVKAYLRKQYKQISVKIGPVVDYVGMTFDFREPGRVRVTMRGVTDEIIKECGVTEGYATPGASCLFDVRDAPKATREQAVWFHSYVCKVLYVAKRSRPECLVSVAFLSTRVNECDIDDLAKLRRLLGYLVRTPERGIVLEIGDRMEVRAFIDAAYGVHMVSGKSHTGCAIVLGRAGPVFAKSVKQKIVTKSSTEAEVVALSDMTSQAIHVRNFVQAQGYELGPAIVYQDNMSCMALMKRGGPTSERSRHIDIRHFWVAERVEEKEVIIEHCGTTDMFANIMTKPVQGAQFIKERQGLTNWD
jgi:hypothetical protein